MVHSAEFQIVFFHLYQAFDHNYFLFPPPSSSHPLAFFLSFDSLLLIYGFTYLKRTQEYKNKRNHVLFVLLLLPLI